VEAYLIKVTDSHHENEVLKFHIVKKLGIDKYDFQLIAVHVIIMVGTIRKAFYDAPDGQILYRYLLTDATEKKAPIVFLHQSASCGQCYHTMMKEYAERGHDCYAPDMPGSVCYILPPVQKIFTHKVLDSAVLMILLRILRLPDSM
jgi:hypothetical protein